jgi:hypothetical protein
MQVNEPKDVKPKMKEHKLRSGVSRQRGIKAKTFSTFKGKSFVHNKNKICPRIDPWYC